MTEADMRAVRLLGVLQLYCVLLSATFASSGAPYRRAAHLLHVAVSLRGVRLSVPEQEGRPLGDVELPPWANGSADEFVRLQRQAA